MLAKNLQRFMMKQSADDEVDKTKSKPESKPDANIRPTTPYQQWLKANPDQDNPYTSLKNYVRGESHPLLSRTDFATNSAARVGNTIDVDKELARQQEEYMAMSPESRAEVKRLVGNPTASNYLQPFTTTMGKHELEQMASEHQGNQYIRDETRFTPATLLERYSHGGIESALLRRLREQAVRDGTGSYSTRIPYNYLWGDHNGRRIHAWGESPHPFDVPTKEELQEKLPRHQDPAVEKYLRGKVVSNNTNPYNRRT